MVAIKVIICQESGVKKASKTHYLSEVHQVCNLILKGSSIFVVVLHDEVLSIIQESAIHPTDSFICSGLFGGFSVSKRRENVSEKWLRTSLFGTCLLKLRCVRSITDKNPDQEATGDKRAVGTFTRGLRLSAVELNNYSGILSDCSTNLEGFYDCSCTDRQAK